MRTSKIIGILLLLSLLSCKKESNDENIVDPQTIVTPAFLITTVLPEEFYYLCKTFDSGYVGIGSTYPGNDYLIVRYDKDFNIIWHKELGGSGFDRPQSIVETNDNGFLVGGWSDSKDGNVTGNHGKSDIWLCRLSNMGELIWERCYGGSQSDILQRSENILCREDGGFILYGTTASSDGDVSKNYGSQDNWLVWINSEGEIEKEVSFGSDRSEYSGHIVLVENDYCVTYSSSAGQSNYIVIARISNDGQILWKKELGGINIGSICLTSDNNVAVAYTDFKNYTIKKFDYKGNSLKEAIIAGRNNYQPFLSQITETSDHGFLISANLSNINASDASLIRIDSKLVEVYRKEFNGNAHDYSWDLVKVDNDKYIYMLSTRSTDLPGITVSSTFNTAVISVTESFEE